MIEFLADKMYEFITTKGIEAIEQLESQYNNQVILYGIIKRFGEGDYFKQEYRGLTYIDQKDAILSISDEKLSPTLGVDEISRNIHDIISHVFIGDDACIDKIKKIIASEYLSKRELTIKLIDLATVEKKHVNMILEEVDEVKQAVEKINSTNEHRQYRKDQVLQCGLGRRIDLFISEAARHYLYWVKKGNVTIMGNKIPTVIQYFHQIKDLIKSDFVCITDEFYKKPIKILIINQLPFETKEIAPIDYMLYVRAIMEKRSEELLIMSDYLPDEFIYVMMEYIDLFVRNPVYSLESKQFTNMSINGKLSSDTDISKEVKRELMAFGNVILKFEPIYNAYLFRGMRY